VRFYEDPRDKNRYNSGVSVVIDYSPRQQDSAATRALAWCSGHRVAVAAVSVALVVCLAAWGVDRRRSRQIVEALQQPVAFTGWTADGVTLADGREVKLPGVRNISPNSRALAEAMKQGGVEFSGGRAYALMKVWHWCGNDPVRLHVARVDLPRVLVFLGEAEPSAPTTVSFERLLEGPAAARRGSDFSAAGWNVSDFFEFRSYCEWADMQAQPATLPSTMPASHLSGGE
jgi:hypothetical protein